MSGFFKKARSTATIKYFLGEGEDDYIELRSELSKAEANKILANSPTGERDIAAGLAFYEYFFSQTIVSWTYTDEEGDPVAPTVEAYRELRADLAKVIDEKLVTHLGVTLGTKVEELEGKLSD